MFHYYLNFLYNFQSIHNYKVIILNKFLMELNEIIYLLEFLNLINLYLI